MAVKREREGKETKNTERDRRREGLEEAESNMQREGEIEVKEKIRYACRSFFRRMQKKEVT